MTQSIKNLPAMQETPEIWILFLGWEDPREEGTATHSSILAGESHGQRSLVGHSPQRHKESHMIEATEHSTAIDHHLNGPQVFFFTYLVASKFWQL